MIKIYNIKKVDCSHAWAKNKSLALGKEQIAFSITRKEKEEEKRKSIFPHRRGINKAITVLCFLD